MIIALVYMSVDQYTDKLEFVQAKKYSDMSDLEGLWGYLREHKKPSTRISYIDDSVDATKVLLYKERFIPVKKRIVINKRTTPAPYAKVKWNTLMDDTVEINQSEFTMFQAVAGSQS